MDKEIDNKTKHWHLFWHFEDIIDPNIDPVAALTLKRRIDASTKQTYGYGVPS
jgi:hypothetical protein